MSEEIKETIKILQSNPLIKSGAYEFIGDSNVTYAEIYILLEHIRNQEQENQQLKEKHNKLVSIIYELRDYVDDYSSGESCDAMYPKDLYEILDKVKE